MFVLTSIFAGAVGCTVKNPVPINSADNGSIGGGGGSTGTPKTVRVSWNQSHAGDVGLTGGGYKVYVRKGSTPTIGNTTPVVVANPGGGIHTTSTNVTLTSGQYYVSVSSYSTNGDSPLSAAYVLVVP